MLHECVHPSKPVMRGLRKGELKKVERMGTNGVTKTEREIDGRKGKREEKRDC